ncbi:MAG: transcriptional repressor MprA [Candidatus Methanofastidiosum methylothiophilum]|uniref:Transcriptional repressor MprA n=1 Tax=Candidatus Methanofastidiosum methylothiophilum TaxID=1705564 RepID=A0A150IQD8_9EURY|nr:MAG: transcriptional repressor MprA [Candidatus Methanofastidiosum methylthiophilus]KYC47193.1 MAG: transcriptional repressor MprA [Candidatus Methanofastidiosum methylthiophilus]KYC51464.1 MAG: transcriptional repressor MprA [Candidatus Methanofastidiosum methylthiophilus]
MANNIRPESFEIFGKIFFLSNRLEYLGDNELRKDGLTTKQWELIAVTGKYFTYPPSVSEVADVLSTTRQNIKQLALKLQEKGFIILERDPKDRRVLRLRLTEKNRKYWESNSDEKIEFISSLFSSLTDKELKELYGLLNKLEENIDLRYKETKSNFIGAIHITRATDLNIKE